MGAVVELGLCLDLTTSTGVQQVREVYKRLLEISEKAEWDLPTNSDDLLRRNLDCAVIQLLHKIRSEAGEPPVDTVKGVCLEGGPVYPKSGFSEKTHSQICVRNLDCIKGVFRVSKSALD